MVGYSEDHTPDTYRLYNPQTNKVIVSRDVSWASWDKTDPWENMEQYADIIPGAPLDDPNQTTTEPNDNNNDHEPSQPHIIPQNPMIQMNHTPQFPQPQAGRKELAPPLKLNHQQYLRQM